MSLTPRQLQILDYVRTVHERLGYAPSYEEIRTHFGFRSLGAVHGHVQALVRKGVLRQGPPNAKRSLTVVDHRATEAAAIPLLGTVAAGRPIEAIAGNDVIEVPPRMLRGEDSFALRVRGRSMIEDGICDGDVIIVRKQPVARDGQTVVASIDGEVTLKRFFHRGDHVELHPANAQMEPLIVREGDFEIVGVLVGLLRDYP